MARPRSANPIVTKSIGLPTSLWAEVDAVAKAAGQSRSAWIGDMVRAGVLRTAVDQIRDEPRRKQVMPPVDPWNPASPKAKQATKKQVIHVQTRGHQPGCRCLMCQ